MNDLRDQAKALWEAEVKRRQRGPFVVRPSTSSPARQMTSMLSTNGSFTVRDLPLSERPRERLSSLGAQALSAAELLACLLGRGIPGESVLVTAQRLLARFGSLYGIAQAPLEQLAQIRGVGKAKAAQLKAACELSRRLENPLPTGRLIETTDAAMALARRLLSGRRRERFIVLLLDARHRILRVAEVSVGTLNMSVVHPRETFREAISVGAAALILAHNHPSGDPTPSAEDLELTRRLVRAGYLLGIPVLDHIIVGAGRSISLKANGFEGFDTDA